MLQVMCDDVSVEVLHRSTHWVLDGTFLMRPRDFNVAQMYSVMGFIESEAVICFVALMPNRHTASYDRIFQVLYNLLMANHGSVGRLEFIHMDFEHPAINSARHWFQRPGNLLKFAVSELMFTSSFDVRVSFRTMLATQNSSSWLRVIVRTKCSAKL